MDALRQDLVTVIRSLRRKPAFVALVAITLGLGIGASTAIFTVFDAALLRPLPFPDADRLVFLGETSPSEPYPRQASYLDYTEWRAQASAFESMGAYGYRSALLTGGDAAEVVAGSRVTASFFPTLGVRPQLGRGFTADEENGGGAVILGHGFWQRRFAGDPSVVGRAVLINGQATTVVGVLPASFRFDRMAPRDVWFPFQPTAEEKERRYQHMFWAIGRLAPGVDIAQARAQLAPIAARIGEIDPQWHGGQGIGAVSLHDDVVGTVKPVLHVLLGAVVLVLLMAAANVANVLLARGAEREREIVLRAALGASRGRLLRQLLLESLVLGLLGGGLGILWAAWGVPALVAAIPASVRGSMAYLDGVGLDARVLTFALLVSLATGALAGILPALRVSRGAAGYQHLKEGAPTVARGRHRLQNALVASEIAVALVLVLSAGLLARSLSSLLRVDPGFDTRNLLTFQIGLPPELSDAAKAVPLQRALLERLTALPGVRGAALADTLSLSGGGNTGTPSVVGRPAATAASDVDAYWREVSAGYFDVMRIPILEGRAISEDEVARQAPVMVINRALQRRLFPGESALGHQLTFAFTGDTHWEIVGVAGDERMTSLDVAPPPALYTRASGGNAMAAVVRTAGDPHALGAAAERTVHELSRDLAVFGTASMEEVIDASPRTFVRRYPALLLASFAGSALLLALVGIYGVLTHDTARRTREIGVRMALGAQRRDVVALLLGRVLALAGAGILVGALGSLLAGRALSALLFGVQPGDPGTTAAAAFLLLTAALLAAWLPARRALAVDPMLALRHD
jgi:putative ABC transport system permease protein